jgi:hypothetical protein
LVSHDGDRVVVPPLSDGLACAKHHHPGKLTAILELRQQEADNIWTAQFANAQIPIAIVPFECGQQMVAIHRIEHLVRFADFVERQFSERRAIHTR